MSKKNPPIKAEGMTKKFEGVKRERTIIEIKTKFGEKEKIGTKKLV